MARNPGSSSLGAPFTIVFAATAVVATVLAVAGGGTSAAAELARFGSCGELEAWARSAFDRPVEAVDAFTAFGDDAGGAAVAGSTAGAEAVAGGQRTGGTGTTNLIVEGVDEGDIVDVVDGDRVLVTAGTGVALVDLERGASLAHLELSTGVAGATGAFVGGAEVTFDPDRSVAWAVARSHRPSDGMPTTVVARVAVGDAHLEVTGTWVTEGDRVGVRRVGDALHVVVSQWIAGDVRPFESSGAVGCTDVWRPAGPAQPSASLGVSFTADEPAGPDGVLVPAAGAAIAGAGTALHLTADAAYVATPVVDGSGAATSIHRFALDGWTYTGSGRVEGSLLGDFAMDEWGDHLRVGHTNGSGAMRPAIDVAVEPVPAPTGRAVEESAPPRNQVTVLDTDGDLDAVGATERFGHPGESIHGIRFDGPVAYVVTFLTTDPFYVLDLADPAAPTVQGELELPGFSAYLHPLGDGLVAGFGPDADGSVAVKLFDVTDPHRPVLVSQAALGHHSLVASDHHAFLSLGEDAFAVPASEWDPAPGGPRAFVVEGRVDDGRLQMNRTEVPGVVEPQRVLARPDRGWAVVAWEEVVVVDAGGEVRHRIPA